ncbi:alpha/beta hydrolase-fold protein [Cesiribacter andamanensis]|uniref:Enterobactin/ferric enterobactin esterase n=1 Tax=Cesiribacter andamanensis AMV16 TaxID=1279009 RepID=M7NAK4_9BACT|nr:alpha/beta hydrolase-fold protein [Cesiribacter andamanensis]EMR04226.1 enterobactin/ferric enterobactin esterase [Cesiribacter andamanensis AMV16]
MARPYFFLLLSLLLLPASGAWAQNSLGASVSLIDEAFEMPQLNRSRSIWVYLPPGYEASELRYPVLYMHDGQHLFDAELAQGGVEWQVDEAITALVEQEESPGVIVVAIASDSQHRGNEYVPWEKSDGTGGEGERYIRFIAETLKPYIDEQYRTRPEREYTGMMGASLGGLISLYAAVRFPEVFGRIGLISPAFWFSPEIIEYVQENPHAYQTRVYMVISEEEGENPVNYVNYLYDRLLEMEESYTPVKRTITPTGGHNETYYRSQFPEAFRWLFPEKPEPAPEPTGIEDLDPESLGIRLYPNPSQNWVRLQLPDGWQQNTRLQLLDARGRLHGAEQLLNPQQPLSLAHLPAGLYYLLLRQGDQRVLLPLIKQ